MFSFSANINMLWITSKVRISSNKYTSIPTNSFCKVYYMGCQ